MKNLLKRVIRKGRSLVSPPAKPWSQPKHSYAQCGEDLIIQFIFNDLQIKRFSYLDIGAYHPYTFSNTMLFYLNGCRGINIEPNPQLFALFLHERPEDINLNVGVAASSGELDFYVLSAATMSTFSKATAEQYLQEEKFSIKVVEKVAVKTVPEIVSEYCAGQFPELLSLDVEGIDLPILKSIVYEHSAPIVICVETLSFSDIGQGTKDNDINSFLQAQGYLLYADTYINTIFVKKDKWLR